MEQTIRCRCLCNRDDLRLFRRYHNARILGIHHKVGTQNDHNLVVAADACSNTFYGSKQHLLNFGQQRALLHSN